MIILDTNVVSEVSKPNPNPRMVAWLDRQARVGLHITAVTIAELFAGLAVLPDGKRKTALTAEMRSLLATLVNPVLSFDEDAANVYADLFARAKANRYTLPVADAQIAAIAALHGFAVATRDVEPFVAAGVAVINPWEE